MRNVTVSIKSPRRRRPHSLPFPFRLCSRLRRLDAIALQGRQEADGRARAGGVGGASSIVDVSRSTSLDATDADGAALADAKSLPEAGPPVDYCIFCYHGTYGVLRPDNVALLTRFVSERGSILPKRFTHCCAKHQRKLAATIRAARNFNLIPFHSKLHPRLRFSNMIPASPSTFRQSAAGGAGVGKGQAQGPSAVQILAGLNTGSLGGARA